MRTSELIAELQRLVDLHGDLEVVSYPDDKADVYRVGVEARQGSDEIVVSFAVLYPDPDYSDPD